ncbi:MAG: hypothetical protein ACRCR4_12675 [Thiotrichaceae bacterium]
MQEAISHCGVSLEYNDALRDTQATAWEYGQPVAIHIRGESDIAKDAYGSIKSRPTDFKNLKLNAMEITYSPTKYKLEKLGLREECDAVIKIAMLDLIEAGLTFRDLETKRMTVDILATPNETDGQRFEVADKLRSDAYGNGYLTVTFSLKRG